MDPLETQFEDELRRLGVRFVRASPLLYDVVLAGGRRRVRLEELAREVATSGDLSRVARFVAEMLVPLEVPAWPEARTNVYWCIERGGLSFGYAMAEKVTERTARVLVYRDPAGPLRWLDAPQLERWGCSLEDVRAAASANLDRLAASASLDVQVHDKVRVLTMRCRSELCSSVVFAPALREQVEPRLGWPVLATVPHREFMWLVSERDRAQLSKLGEHVRDAFRTGEHPVSTEVLHVSDGGIRAIAAFPE